MIGDSEVILSLARRIAIHDQIEGYWEEQHKTTTDRNVELTEQLAEVSEEREVLLSEIETLRWEGLEKSGQIDDLEAKLAEMKRQAKTLASIVVERSEEHED